MSFDERIAALIQRLPKLVDHLLTEEATKNALVMPFIAALGYDVFNPHEVVPEFICDVGTKKGEKVDYAIKRDGEIILLIECKKVGVDLAHADASQLYRYFSVTKARIALLTNGIQYRFFSDLEDANKMDSRPFLELDLHDPRPTALEEVRKLSRGSFDLDLMLSVASELKYLSEIKKVLAVQMETPDEDLVRFFFAQVNPGCRFTASSKELFASLVPRAFSQFVSEKVSNRLRSALQSENQAGQPPGAAAEEQPSGSEAPGEDGVVTTEEEMEAYRIVKAIVCRVVHPQRIVQRDAKSYMGILLDDNNRKPICRLWFNTKQRYLGLFDAEKKETRIPIDGVEDIYQYAEQLMTAAQAYEKIPA